MEELSQFGQSWAFYSNDAYLEEYDPRNSVVTPDSRGIYFEIQSFSPNMTVIEILQFFSSVVTSLLLSDGYVEFSDKKDWRRILASPHSQLTLFLPSESHEQGEFRVIDELRIKPSSGHSNVLTCGDLKLLAKGITSLVWLASSVCLLTSTSWTTVAIHAGI